MSYYQRSYYATINGFIEGHEAILVLSFYIRLDKSTMPLILCGLNARLGSQD